jgi:hypothetical protein
MILVIVVIVITIIVRRMMMIIIITMIVIIFYLKMKAFWILKSSKCNWSTIPRNLVNLLVYKYYVFIPDIKA